MNALNDIEALLEERAGWEATTLGRNALSVAVRRRMEQSGVANETLYAEALSRDASEFSKLVDELVVPETWFFREPKVFHFLGRHAVEHWLSKTARGPLRILSAPCSTGEEPYSIAMTLLDCGLSKERFVVDAVDICQRSLDAARRGVYGGSSFRRGSPCDRHRHFEERHRGEFCIKEHVRECVQFRQGNLMTPDFFQAGGPYDVIFFRNLMIYLIPSRRQQLLDGCRQALAKGGLLFVGHAEGMSCVLAGFQLRQMDGAFFFQASLGDVTTDRSPARSAEPHFWSETRRASSASPLRERILPPPREQSSLFSGSTLPLGTVSPATEEPADRLATAQRLADAGQLAEAQRLCEDQISRGGPSAEAFFLMGLVQIAAGNQRLAETQFQKATYMNPRHVESLRHLALLAESRGDIARAKLCRQRLERVAGTGEEKK